MSISAEQVRALREKCGCGFVDAKQALIHFGDDLESAEYWLKNKDNAVVLKKNGKYVTLLELMKSNQ